MFEIDKAKFGTFVAQLRKEKGLMQKDLAQRLYVSDKAVSKWERGLSIPDVSLLVPLAEILGVTVTELLECRRVPKDETMDSRQAEDLVKKVIVFTEEEQGKWMPHRLRRGLQLLLCGLAGILEIGLPVLAGMDLDGLSAVLFTLMGLMAGFGLYFCCFTREKLPKYYDENKISTLSDGILRMNIPGVYFNNRNWPYIVRAGQLWAMTGLAALPAIYFAGQAVMGEFWKSAGGYILLSLSLGGLFIPMFLVARKYEYAPDSPRHAREKKRGWIRMGAGAAVIVVLTAVIYAGGLNSRGSGLRMGWAEGKTADSWNAAYFYHDGYQERTVNKENVPAQLHAEVVTRDGDLSILITDREGNVVFEKADIPTSTFSVEIPGTVIIKITGKQHRGSFSLKWQKLP